MTTTQLARPSWYTAEDDTAWGKVKAAFRRDWQQTKYDMGSKVPNLNQQVGDTVSQATGAKPIPVGNTPSPHPGATTTDVYRDEDEPAYRYGYAAYRHHGTDWDDVIEANIREEWGDNETDWERRREAIRRGWTYGRIHRDGQLPM